MLLILSPGKTCRPEWMQSPDDAPHSMEFKGGGVLLDGHQKLWQCCCQCGHRGREGGVRLHKLSETFRHRGRR